MSLCIFVVILLLRLALLCIIYDFKNSIDLIIKGLFSSEGLLINVCCGDGITVATTDFGHLILLSNVFISYYALCVQELDAKWIYVQIRWRTWVRNGVFFFPLLQSLDTFCE